MGVDMIARAICNLLPSAKVITAGVRKCSRVWGKTITLGAIYVLPICEV